MLNRPPQIGGIFGGVRIVKFSFKMLRKNRKKHFKFLNFTFKISKYKGIPIFLICFFQFFKSIFRENFMPPLNKCYHYFKHNLILPNINITTTVHPPPCQDQNHHCGWLVVQGRQSLWNNFLYIICTGCPKINVPLKNKFFRWVHLFLMYQIIIFA